MDVLTYEALRDGVGGAAVGVRARIELEPLGGPGDKVFPPTYAVPDSASTRYAMEQRRVDGDTVPTVVLDSVASQANRFELALLAAYRDGDLRLPVVSVDFRQSDGLVGLDRLSDLETSHRIFDAALRDSLLDGLLFRLSGPGQAVTTATPRDAAALYHYSPTTLLFGGWDSTGPRGGLGSRYERAITSEVVALGVETGTRTASRIDALAVPRGAGPLYETPDGDWTLDPAEARQERGEAVKYGGTQKDAGRPSLVNHGNVAPSLDPRAGGITADRIQALVVLSFAALRKLRFPTDHRGEPIPDDRRRQTEVAAWTALAALGLAASVLAVEDGFDLRSRCALVPTRPLRFELLSRDGSPPAEVGLDRDAALELVERSRLEATALGLPWMEDELLLEPAPKLVELVRRGQALAARGEGE